MARPSTLPDEATLRQWYENKQMTLADMVGAAVELGYPRVTENAFTMAFRRFGWEPRLRFYYDTLPWEVRPDHEGHRHQRNLRRYARREAGETLKPRELSALESWLAEMNTPQPNNKPPAPWGAVVQYEYDTPEGFYAVPRRKGEKGMIRRPRRDQPLRKRTARAS